MKRTPITAAHVEAAKKMQADGASHVDIAKALDIAKATVWRVLTRGVTPSRMKPITEEQRAECMRLRAEKWSHRRIAKATGVSIANVREVTKGMADAKKRPLPADESVLAAVEAYRGGLSQARCLAKYGIGIGRLRRALDEAGLERRPPGRSSWAKGEKREVFSRAARAKASTDERMSHAPLRIVRIADGVTLAGFPGKGDTKVTVAKLLRVFNERAVVAELRGAA